MDIESQRSLHDRVEKVKPVRGSKRELLKIALKLYDAGFNVIPVGSNKRPLTSWGVERRIEGEKLEELLDKASGIAIVGGSENPWKPVAVLAIIDIDNPNILGEKPHLKSIVESTVAWKTGPRCPSCSSKSVKRLGGSEKFKCEECGAEFDLDSARRGIGALITVGPDIAEKYLKGTIRGKDVEILVNNYALIPPSLHSSGIRYEWIKPLDFDAPNYGIRALVESELVNLLEELGVKQVKREKEAEEREEQVEAEVLRPEVAVKPVAIRELQELSDSEILELKNLLKDVYAPGNRQYIWLFLSGWAAKTRVSPISIARVLKILYDESKDTDPLKTRASAIVYTYKKAGINIDKYAEEFENILGVKPYGLEREISEEEVKGKAGLQEILEQALGEDKALETIRRIEEIFGGASPYRDSVIVLLDYEKQLYAVANLRRLEIIRARRDGNRLIYKEKVTNGAPVEVVVYDNPFTGSRKYQVRWEADTRKPLIIGPVTIEEILARLKTENLVIHKRIADDVVGPLLEAFVRKGKAIVKEEIEAPGFYLVEGKIVTVRLDIKEPDTEELKAALELLNELAEWYKHVQDKFTMVVKWGIIAPFNYALKQKGRWLKWLYLYGASKTGKTTIGEIILSMWGLDSRHVKTGASIDTPARIGHVLSQSTFPVLVNEPGGALSKEEIVEIIKSAIESTVARGKYVRGVYEEIPALSVFMFTSNKYLPKDDALLRRLIVLRFTYGERIPDEKAREFESKVKPRLKTLKALGKYIASKVINNPSLLDMDWEELSTQLLEAAYREAELTPPQWIYSKVSLEENIYEDLKEAVRAFLVERINEEYTRFVGRVVVEISDRSEVKTRQELGFVERCRVVLENKLLPWAVLKDDTVYFLTPLVEELRPVVGDIGGLKSVGELMGWEYKNVKIGNRVVRAATTSFNALVELLSGEVED